MGDVIPATFFALSPTGTFYETDVGPGSYSRIVKDIAGGQYEVAQVFRMSIRGNPVGDVTPRFVDVSHIVVQDVFRIVAKPENAKTGFIPSFVEMHDPEGADMLRRSWTTAEQRRADEAEAAADELYQEAAE